MGNEVTIEVKVKNSTSSELPNIDRGLKGIGESAKQSGADIDKGFARARDSLGRFVKSGEQGAQSVTRKLSEIDGAGAKLSGLFGKFNSSFLKGLDGPAKQIADFVEQVDKVGGAMATAGAAGTAFSGMLGSLTDGVGMLAGIVPAVVGGFLAFGPALSIAAGAAAAAATALAGLGGTLAVLKIGFGGIGAALTAHSQQVAGAGKAASNTAAQERAYADRIASATRTLRDAKDSEKQASVAVTKAIADEIDRRRELDLQLRDSVVSQSEAKQALIEATEKYQRAQQAGSDWEKAEAKNAMDRAQITYDEQSEKVKDLTKDKAKATKDGVMGSDQVQTALTREKKAQENVATAAHALAEAKIKDAAASAGAAGGVNAFAAAMDKLSPNARKLVYALLDIEKRFDVIKRKVQDHLLAGFDTDVEDLAGKWLPALDDILVGLADHLNKFGHNLAGALGNKDFINNIKGAMRAFGGFIDQMSGTGDALVDVFGRLARSGAPVLKVIGGFIEGIAKRFDSWIKSADKSGKLDDFMAGAAKTLQQIFDITNDLITIAADLIDIFFPSSQKNGQSALDSIDKALKSVDKYLNDPKTRKNIKEFLDGMQQIYDFVVHDLGPIFVWVAKVLAKAVGAMLGFISMIPAAFRQAKSKIFGIWDDITDGSKSRFGWFGRMGSWLSNTLSGSFNGLRNGFRSVMNWVIGKWDSLNFTLPAVLGGGTYGVGHIPFMASGGIANGLTMINERGAELVKLPSGSMVYPSGQSKGMMQNAGRGGGDTILYLPKSGNDLEDVLLSALAGRIRKRGGNVQVVLGTRGATTT